MCLSWIARQRIQSIFTEVKTLRGIFVERVLSEAFETSRAKVESKCLGGIIKVHIVNLIDITKQLAALYTQPEG